MSVPIEYDFAQIKIGNGGGPETFAVICDLINVSINEGAVTTQKYRKDCDYPGTPPKRRSRTTGTFWDITGSGLVHAPQSDELRAAIGVRKNYEVDVFKDDGTAGGELLGTYSGEAIMTTRNVSINREGDSGVEYTLEGQDTLAFDQVGAGS